MESNKGKIKFAFNLHAYGNLLIHPFNYDNKQNSELKKDFPKQYEVYQDIFQDKDLIPGVLIGNGM